jgi:hypothetical protein
MRISSILLIELCFVFIIVNSAVVNLDCAQIQESFVLQTQEIYAGQFPCLPDTANGSRTLLRFSVVLNNLDDTAARLTPYRNPFHIIYQFNSSSTVLRSGYLNVTCLRDTVCDGPRRFMYCGVGGLGPACNMSLDRRLPCQWVDITDLLINNIYSLRLALSPGLSGAGIGVIDTTPCQFYVTPSSLDYLTIGGWRMQLGVFLSLTGLPTLFIIVTCVMHSMQKSPSFHIKRKQMYRNIQYKSE